MKTSLRNQRKMCLLLTIALLCCAVLPGHAEQISPTTGLSIPGEATTPVMVVISFAEGSDRVEGRRITAPGMGKRQVWGGLDADMVFETLFTQKGGTRLLFLYHDALVRGEQVSAGPVRSVRDVHVKLTAWWRAGLVCRATHPYSAPALEGYAGRIFSLASQDRWDYFSWAEARKGGDNMSADVTAIHARLQDEPSPSTSWYFDWTDTDGESAIKPGEDPEIKWPGKSYTDSFRYDAGTGKYGWYANGAPVKSWKDASFTADAPMVFDNVVVLYARHHYPVTALLPVVDMEEGNRGDAVVWTKGVARYGFWQVTDGRVELMLASDEPMPLSPGKTYVAVLPTEE